MNYFSLSGTTNYRKYRITELDGLRGIAALAVVLYHFTTRFEQRFDTDLSTKVWEFKYGFYGVDLFFIISGFVIFMTVEKVRTPAEFAYKRFIRLYPTFWLCLLITFLFTTWYGPAVFHRTFQELVINTTMVPSLFNTRYIDGAYWSLLIELCFYLVILFMMIFYLIPKVKWVGFVYLLFYLAISIYYKHNIQLFYGTLFLAGINFYKIWKGTSDWVNHLQICCCLALAYFFTDLITFIFIAVFYLVFYLVVYRQAKLLSWKPIVFIGQISYALYLLHQYIGQSIQLILIEHNLKNYYLLLFSPILICILLAYLITFWFERPLIAYLTDLYKNSESKK